MKPSVNAIHMFYTFVLLLLMSHGSVAFVPSLSHSSISQRAWNRGICATDSNVDNKSQACIDDIRSMSVKLLKEELKRMKQPIHDVFEKEQLVQRLYQARLKQPEASSPTASSTSPNSETNAPYIQVPLYLTSQTPEYMPVSNNGFMVPVKLTYLILKVSVPGFDRPLSLLFDTGCTGLILRPTMASLYKLSQYGSTTASVSGLGGQQDVNTIVLLPFQLGNRPMIPLPAVSQDISGLPPDVDGIIGLSLTSQFQLVEMNIKERQFRFYPRKPVTTTTPTSNQTLVAQTDLQVSSKMDLLTIPVYFGTRGPVTMIFDSGAASTCLDWKGVAQLGLQRNSPAIAPLSSMGAMGSDNVDIALTHRLYVSSSIQIGNNSSLKGLDLQGQRLPIDIGRFPILDQLPEVGGILGMDVLMQASRVEFHSTPPYRVMIYQE
jgi:hypothetical protein